MSERQSRPHAHPPLRRTRGLASIGVAELASRGYVVVTVDHTYEVAAVDFPHNLIDNTVGTAGAGRVLRALRTYLPAFFDQHLRDRPRPVLRRRALPETAFVD